MNILIGDIGNTVTKICLTEAKNSRIKKIIYFDSNSMTSKKALKKNLRKITKNKLVNKVALFSSVVPKYKIILKNFLFKKYKIQLKEIKEKEINKIVKINIKNKNEVGADRIANAVGVYKKYKTNCIVLDFGTATTFDIVTKEGIYNGGVIAPGINISMAILSKSADQIPIFDIKKQSKIIGKSTKEALRSGFYWGYLGLVNNIILKIQKETKKNYKVVFTGGYANLFKTSIIRPFTVDKNITIKGIVEIFKFNIKKLS